MKTPRASLCAEEPRKRPKHPPHPDFAEYERDELVRFEEADKFIYQESSDNPIPLALLDRSAGLKLRFGANVNSALRLCGSPIPERCEIILGTLRLFDRMIWVCGALAPDVVFGDPPARFPSGATRGFLFLCACFTICGKRANRMHPGINEILDWFCGLSVKRDAASREVCSLEILILSKSFPLPHSFADTSPLFLVDMCLSHMLASGAICTDELLRCREGVSAMAMVGKICGAAKLSRRSARSEGVAYLKRALSLVLANPTRLSDALGGLKGFLDCDDDADDDKDIIVDLLDVERSRIIDAGDPLNLFFLE